MLFYYQIAFIITELILYYLLNSIFLCSLSINVHSSLHPRRFNRFFNKIDSYHINPLNHVDKNRKFGYINQNPSLFQKNTGVYRNFLKFSKNAEVAVDQEEVDSELIRNFCIIAHVDHGKSTLADRFLQFTKAVPPERFKDQYLDNMDLERERGITIKLQTALIKYKSFIDGRTYTLNLIDTPGHIDFNHEARRSISACEGAILVVDGTKGIEAQTVTTANIAIEKGLKIIPVVNKIDMGHCDYESTAINLKKHFDFTEAEILKASAKQGTGIEDILEAVVGVVPPPKVDLEKPFRALVFDSIYDNNKGAICYVRVFEGSLKVGDEITLMNAKITSKVTALGVLLPDKREETDSLQSGQVGWITAGIKNTSQIEVGDTISLKKNLVEPVHKFESSKPTVFAGIYPCIGGDFDKLQTALEKLKLNDHSFHFETSNSSLVGHGFKCGFNGLLHLDIIVQRLDREFDTQVIVTSPSVPYRCTLRDGTVIMVDDAAKWPDDKVVQSSEEPWTYVTVRTQQDSLGEVMSMMNKMRARFLEKTAVRGTNMVVMEYEIPMCEILSDFFSKLKSVTNGFGSYDYEGTFYQPIELCKMRILLNGDEAVGLAVVVPRKEAHERGKFIVQTLVKLIPKRQFKVPVQAVVGRKVIASASIPAVRKDVTERCSGGDPSRKRKLLENQASVSGSGND
ncbi:uncharacterized protein TOT_010000988 [Theileria orientalis strain Shintoku]|uniref:Translation factor GUF1 homolog, mitochondrial n=1 Tax=Theileria orientalis strain Shintoku TaxID=869250 RepID=J4C7S2_THEOR|nr:uncharacterized protein TOT_010000988 [Theileria orientalis strain Shintoku]BAM39533.1 uncharacterized protein TOT_010000988 [Theileria orientalis strain Shintoku]|eukprot:XP_009689834.1 uncharacterized protein TOT_010000988 [Theileria orientalis strain Shintoku]